MAGFLDELKSEVLTTDGEADLRRRMEEAEKEFLLACVDTILERIKKELKSQVKMGHFKVENGQKVVAGSSRASLNHSALNETIAEFNFKYGELLKECAQRDFKDDIIHRGSSINDRFWFHFPESFSPRATETTKKGFFKHTHTVTVTWTERARQFYESLTAKMSAEGIHFSFSMEIGSKSYSVKFPVDKLIIEDKSKSFLFTVHDSTAQFNYYVTL